MPYRIDYQKDHENSKGESAPWVIIKEDRDEIVDSSMDNRIKRACATCCGTWRA